MVTQCGFHTPNKNVRANSRHCRYPMSDFAELIQPTHFTFIYGLRVNREALPAHFYIAFLQGEALLRLKFFSYLQERSITDPDSLTALWQQLIVDRCYIQQVVEKSGLLDYFYFGDKESQDSSSSGYKEQCFTAYCILLFDAHESGNKNVVLGLTKGLVVHFMPQLFPEQAKVTDINLLKKEIAKSLALH